MNISKYQHSHHIEHIELFHIPNNANIFWKREPDGQVSAFTPLKREANAPRQVG